MKINKFNVSCQDNLQFMRNLENGSMKLIVTSPPYNIGKTYEKKKPLDYYIENQVQVISECVRLLHPNGSLCWQVGNLVDKGEIYPLDIVLYPYFKQHGLKLRNRIIWHFGHGLHCKKRFSGRYETILWFTKGDKYTFNLDAVRIPSKYPNKKHYKGPNRGKLSSNPAGKNPSDIWEIPNVKNNHVEKTSHPCQFPVELIERLVLSLTNEQDNVLDPYMGVGSTLIAAIKHQRYGYGCDIIQEYIDIAMDRIHAQLSGTLKTREMGKPIYNPHQS
jgi:adenine-specific DNA-methyltransferase